MTSGHGWRGGAWTALAVLTGVNLLNYVDRYVLSGVLPLLQQPPEQGGLGLSNEQGGTLASAFIVAYTLLSPAFGLLADRWRRTWLLAAGVALWSVVTAACGLSAGFVGLLALRASTGIGEAAYAAVAPAVLSDHFPRGARSRIMSIFNAAIPVGAAIGFLVGGWVGTHFGWRTAFLVAGGPGLVLAFLVAWMRDPPRGAMDPGEAHGAPPDLRQAAGLLRRRRFMLPCLGYALQTAGFGSVGIWLPKYLVAAKGLPLDHATMLFGGITVVTGLVGTLVGGAWSDRWYRRNPTAHLRVCALSTLAAAPVVALILFSEAQWAIWTVTAIGCFLIVMSVGPVNSQIVNVLGSHERATGTALSIFILHFLGDVPAIPLVGWVADHAGWGNAFGLIPLFLAAGGAVWWWAAVAEAGDAARMAAPRAGGEGAA